MIKKIRSFRSILQRVLFLLSVCFICQTAFAQNNAALIGLVRRKFKLMNSHDLDSAASLYSDSARITSVGFPGVKTGPAGFKSVYSRYFTSTPDLHYTITRIIPAGSTVTVEYTSRGTIRHVEQPASSYMVGRSYTLQNCCILEVSHQHIISEMTYFDQVSFLSQVGFFNRQQ